MPLDGDAASRRAGLPDTVGHRRAADTQPRDPLLGADPGHERQRLPGRRLGPRALRLALGLERRPDRQLGLRPPRAGDAVPVPDRNRRRPRCRTAGRSASGWASPPSRRSTTRGRGSRRCFPIPNAIQVPVASTVVAVFDSDLDPASIVPGTILVERTIPTPGVVPAAWPWGRTPRRSSSLPCPRGAGGLSGDGLRPQGHVRKPHELALRLSPSGRRTTCLRTSRSTRRPPPSFLTSTTYTLGLNWTAADVRLDPAQRQRLERSDALSRGRLAQRDLQQLRGRPDVAAGLRGDADGLLGQHRPTARLYVPVTVDAKPSVAIQVTSATTLAAGQTLTGQITASDDRALTFLRLYVSGPFGAYLEWPDRQRAAVHDAELLDRRPRLGGGTEESSRSGPRPSTTTNAARSRPRPTRPSRSATTRRRRPSPTSPRSAGPLACSPERRCRSRRT